MERDSQEYLLAQGYQAGSDYGHAKVYSVFAKHNQDWIETVCRKSEEYEPDPIAPYSRAWWTRVYPSMKHLIPQEYRPLIEAFIDGEDIEVYSGIVWCGFYCGNPRFDASADTYRIKSKIKYTQLVSVRNIPLPESEQLKCGTKYYIPDLDKIALCESSVWSNHRYDYSRLKRGLVYLHKEAAIERAKVFIDQLTPQEED